MHGPIFEKLPKILHGSDYNPEQWLKTPEIIDEDMRMMKLAGYNVVSIGIFSWAHLEPSEGVYDFSFLDMIMDKLAENGIFAILATPSGARPRWLAQKYPEVLRVTAKREKLICGERHNHCYASPVFREKITAMNTRLAERYKDHPALLMWHISNEMSGDCHCENCQAQFREFLKREYDNDLEKLNDAWWSSFWSRRYTDWEEIYSPSPLGDSTFHGLNLAWRKFETAQAMDYLNCETEPLRRITPDVKITTNMMNMFHGFNYEKLHECIDVISWDSYPAWHSYNDVDMAAYTAFVHDYFRSLKKRPFMLMESTPSLVNWHDYNCLKRPGMHRLSSLQAIAHGSDTVQYFQWRKSRGGSEKFHGAVVDHCGRTDTRVFTEVSELGKLLSKLDGVVGSHTASEVGIYYSTENRWALEDCKGYAPKRLRYLDTVAGVHRYFWERAISADIVFDTDDLNKYKLIILPMAYMLTTDMIAKIADYTKNGGHVIATYITGLVDRDDLCYLGGFPANELKDVFGLWAEETDTLSQNRSEAVSANGKTYKVIDFFERIHPDTAQVIASYDSGYMKGLPSACRNTFGSGEAYYIAFRDDGAYMADLLGSMVEKLDIKAAADKQEDGVIITKRGDYLFVQNYTEASKKAKLPTPCSDLETGEVTDVAELSEYGCRIFVQKQQ